MHDFRKQTGRVPRQAVDGFLSGAARPQPHADVRRSLGQRSMRLDGLRTPNRGVDGFRRVEGFHPATPMQSHATSIGEPVKPLQQVVSQSAAKQQASLLHMTLPTSGALGAKSAKKERGRGGKPKQQSRWRSVRRWSFRTALVLVAVVLLTGGFLTAKGLLKVRKVFRGGGTAAALQANVAPQLLKGEGSGRVNIVLFGKGGGDHDGPDLTDTILVLSIDPVNNSAAMVSVPRDLWVTVQGYGSTKINAVYANAKYHALSLNAKDAAGAEKAGIDKAETVISSVLGIPINYYVMVDFKGFQQAVDTVGGVDLNVPSELAVVDHMYNEDTQRPYLLNVSAGQQHFDGLKALMFARSRHTSPRGDFDRSERQRLLIEALGQKVLSAGTYSNPAKISGLMSAFGDHISTDFSITDALRLMGIGKKIGSKINSLDLDTPTNQLVTTAMLNSLSVVLPKAGQDNYSDIQAFVRSNMKDGYIVKENANITVLNGTHAPGLASTKADLLKSYGYNIGTVGDAPTATYQTTVLVDLSGGKKPYTQHYLETRFGVKAVSKLPDSTIQATGADFVLILGQDAAANQSN